MQPAATKNEVCFEMSHLGRVTPPIYLHQANRELWLLYSGSSNSVEYVLLFLTVERLTRHRSREGGKQPTIKMWVEVGAKLDRPHC